MCAPVLDKAQPSAAVRSTPFPVHLSGHLTLTLTYYSVLYRPGGRSQGLTPAWEQQMEQRAAAEAAARAARYEQVRHTNMLFR